MTERFTSHVFYIKAITSFSIIIIEMYAILYFTLLYPPRPRLIFFVCLRGRLLFSFLFISPIYFLMQQEVGYKLLIVITFTQKVGTMGISPTASGMKLWSYTVFSLGQCEKGSMKEYL